MNVPFSPPTRETCPPPSPRTDKDGTLSQDEVYKLISKANPQKMFPQYIHRSNSAETKRHAQPPYTMDRPRSRSGSHIGEGCDVPSFDLGVEFDLPNIKSDTSSVSANKNYDFFDTVDPEEVERACIEAEQSRNTMEKPAGLEINTLSPSNFKTPMKEVDSVQTASISAGTGSSTVPHHFERR